MNEYAPETTEKTRKERVKFGLKPWQNIPHDCAEWMLTAWKEKSPKQFGDMLQAAMMRDQ